MRNPIRFVGLAGLALCQFTLLQDLPTHSLAAALPAVFFALCLAREVDARPARFDLAGRLIFGALTGYASLLCLDTGLLCDSSLAALGMALSYYWPALLARLLLETTRPATMPSPALEY